MIDKGSLGSQIAKNGFENEKDIVNRFNRWQDHQEARDWLETMGYDLNKIFRVTAMVLHGQKADVSVQIEQVGKHGYEVQNIQVKLVSNKSGSNQLDKRKLSHYKDMWQMPDNIYELLGYFCGENPPISKFRNEESKRNPKSSKRMFLTEFTRPNREAILVWFRENKLLILSDTFRGRGAFSAEWVLVAKKNDASPCWVLKNINDVLHYYGQGEVAVSKKGSIKLGRVTVQRKGGDNDCQTANMLQFKIDPTELFDI